MSIKKNFPVLGLGCAACVARVENILKEQPGIVSANVSLAANMAQVEYNPDIIKAIDIKKAVQASGYDIVVPEGIDEEESAGIDNETWNEAEEIAEKVRIKEYMRLKTNMWLAIILAVLIMLISFGFIEFEGKGIILAVLSAVSVFGAGWRFLRSAISQAKHFHAGMDTLVALSTTVAWLFSFFNLIFKNVIASKGFEACLYFDSGAMIVAFVLVGKLLEEKAKYRTTDAVRKLSGLRPQKTDIKPGDIVIVKPGQRIQADGIVVEGNSFVDESMLTGEPVPVEKIAGSNVFAGTMNQKGAFSFKAEKTGSDTVLSSIIKMVKDAQGSKPEIQKVVDKIASVFVPVVLILAFIAFFYWIFSPEGGLAKALLTMVSVLVIACPCSLGLATPTAIIAGIGRAAGMGILIKDANALQQAKNIDNIVLDKTGTLTLGRPEVKNQYWYDENYKGVLKDMEIRSEHPLAGAILKTLEDVKIVKVDNFKAIPGKGITAEYEGKTLYVGHRLREPSTLTEEWLRQGRTIVCFYVEDKLIAVFAISDELKESSIAAVKKLKDMKISVTMLTGDNIRAAESIASEAGIDDVKAGMLPEDKAKYIVQLQKSGQKVAMVGDGINDSAALADADISIAMGSGSDIAMDVSMITIVSSDLSKLPEMILLSGKASKIIRENLFWAFIYNIIAIPAAAGMFGFSLNPMISSACMAFSSVCVVLNSLRLTKV